MFQKKMDQTSMSDAAYLDQAATWSKDLTRMRARGPGDLENAMRSIERDYGVDYWFVWQLRYKRDRLKFISVSVYERIKAAYAAECQRQIQKLTHEITRTEKIAGFDNRVVVAVRALARKEVEGHS